MSNSTSCSSLQELYTSPAREHRKLVAHRDAITRTWVDAPPEGSGRSSRCSASRPGLGAGRPGRPSPRFHQAPHYTTRSHRLENRIHCSLTPSQPLFPRKQHSQLTEDCRANKKPAISARPSRAAGRTERESCSKKPGLGDLWITSAFCINRLQKTASVCNTTNDLTDITKNAELQIYN